MGEINYRCRRALIEYKRGERAIHKNVFLNLLPNWPAPRVNVSNRPALQNPGPRIVWRRATPRTWRRGEGRERREGGGEGREEGRETRARSVQGPHLVPCLSINKGSGGSACPYLGIWQVTLPGVDIHHFVLFHMSA